MNAKSLQIDDAVPDSDVRLAGIIQSAMDAVITIDEEQRIVLCNPAAERIFQLSKADLIGQPIERLIPDRFRKQHAGHVRRFGETGVASRQMGTYSQLLALRADGVEFPVEASISQTTVGGKKLFTAILRDVTERVRAEHRIHEQAELLNKVTNAIMVLDTADRITFWNQGAERLYGWSAREVEGRTPAELFRVDLLDAITRAETQVNDTGEWSGDLRERTKVGRSIIVESHWSLLRDDIRQPRGKIIINIDVTDERELEARFLRAQRLESVGTLVSGIAHDLNNVMTPILMAVKLLQKNKPGIDRDALLETAGASVERGTAMIRQLLAFAGGPEGERVALDLRVIVQEVQGILQHTLVKTMVVESEVVSDLWPVAGDATQISQVLMNLSVNARDAMPQGGHLRITAANKVFNSEIASLYPDGKPGPYVVLCVSDTGTGIPPDVQERMFDPFFTTKPFGTGTGLGLSTAIGIVKSHGGFINVYSELNHGTKFIIYLPATVDTAIAVHRMDQDEDWQGQGETILVVDDEPFILLMTKATLESNGYKVLTAKDGQAAIDLYRERHPGIAAVVLDMMMPVMDGPATMMLLKAMDPNVKIIAASGLRLAERPAAALAAGAISFLKKPYSDSELLQTLSQILHGR